MTIQKGSCHCGGVRFEANWAPGQVMTCNCSICSRMGWRLAFIGADDFKLVSGEKLLNDYQFGKKNTHHPFCTRCGTHAFSYGKSPDGATMYSVNTRCLHDVDTLALDSEHFDGASL